MDEKYSYCMDYVFISIDEWYKVTSVKDVEHIPNMW